MLMQETSESTTASKQRQRQRQEKPKETAEDNAQPTRKSNAISKFFDHFAAHVTHWAGSPIAFGMALCAVVLWAITGPVFGYSETWQLVVNTGTTIVTFLMVFLIQQNQNKDSRALHLKLDELLLAMKGADEQLVDAEQLDEDKLLALAAACTARARAMAHGGRRKGNKGNKGSNGHGNTGTQAHHPKSVRGTKRTVRASLRVRRGALRVGKAARH
ncbi:Low affinity iron permease [compost metagenome]|jgi:low affinity Fe/Cu permease